MRTDTRAREASPRYSPLGNGCIEQRYAQAREARGEVAAHNGTGGATICAQYAPARDGRRLFCPLEKGGRNHAEPFFVPDMAMKRDTPVSGTGAADFCMPPPLPVLATAWLDSFLSTPMSASVGRSLKTGSVVAPVSLGLPPVFNHILKGILGDGGDTLRGLGLAFGETGIGGCGLAGT